MSICSLWCPAYASLSDQERQRASTCSTYLAEQLNWQLQRLGSAEGPHKRAIGCPRGNALGNCGRPGIAISSGPCAVGMAVHLVEELHSSTRSGPRLTGYSDITVLHGLWQRRNWGPLLPRASPARGQTRHQFTCQSTSGRRNQLQRGRSQRKRKAAFVTKLRLLVFCLPDVCCRRHGWRPAMPPLMAASSVSKTSTNAPTPLIACGGNCITDALNKITGFIGGCFPLNDQLNTGRGPSLKASATGRNVYKCHFPMVYPWT